MLFDQEKELYDLAWRNGMNECRALVTMARKFMNEKHWEQIPGEMDDFERKWVLCGCHAALDVLEEFIKASLEKRAKNNDETV